MRSFCVLIVFIVFMFCSCDSENHQVIYDLETRCSNDQSMPSHFNKWLKEIAHSKHYRLLSTIDSSSVRIKGDTMLIEDTMYTLGAFNPNLIDTYPRVDTFNIKRFSELRLAERFSHDTINDNLSSTIVKVEFAYAKYDPNGNYVATVPLFEYVVNK